VTMPTTSTPSARGSTADGQPPLAGPGRRTASAAATGPRSLNSQSSRPPARVSQVRVFATSLARALRAHIPFATRRASMPHVLTRHTHTCAPPLACVLSHATTQNIAARLSSSSTTPSSSTSPGDDAAAAQARASRSSYVSPYSSSSLGSPSRPSAVPPRAKPTSLPPLPNRRSTQSSSNEGADGATASGVTAEANDDSRAATRRSVTGVASAPQFYLGGGNGVKLLQGLLEGKGWQRIPAGPAGRASSQFKLKWCERSSDFDFANFREGRQMIGRNPKIACIGNKLRLRQTLTE